MEKAREFQKNIYFCFIDYAKAFDCVDHNKWWQVLKEMGVPDHLICLLGNLYAGQEATVRTGHGTTDWFKIEKGVWQGCILLPCLFNLYAEYIMRKAELDESPVGIKIAGRNINNLRYADDTTLMAGSEEELKSLLMRVKEESAKVGLKLNIKKTKIMASSPLTSWQIDGEEMEVVTDFIFLGSKITADRDCSQEIRRRLLLGRRAMANLGSILKSRDITLPKKVRIVKAMVFPVAINKSFIAITIQLSDFILETVECIRELKGTPTAAAELLLKSVLELTSESWFRAFLDALHAAGYSGLCKAIENWDFQTIENLENYRKFLKKIKPSLLDIDPDHVLPYMKDCIRQQEWEEIKQAKINNGRAGAAAKLLECLYRTDKENWPKTFQLALDQADYLKESELWDMKEGSKNDNDVVMADDNEDSCIVDIQLHYSEEAESDCGSPSAPSNVSRQTTKVPKEARSYQKELAQPALDGKHTIISAPTGSGKTFVSVMICDHHLHNMPAGRRGKVVFLATKVPVYEQQKKVFEESFKRSKAGQEILLLEMKDKKVPPISSPETVQETDSCFSISDSAAASFNLPECSRYTVAGICGENSAMAPIDMLIEENDIIVMTPQILLNCLNDGTLSSLSLFTLMIFDECHNTTGNHPYSVLMSKYLDLKFEQPNTPLPQIVGMTASLGVGNAKDLKETKEYICKICAALNAEVISTVRVHTKELEEIVYKPQKRIKLVSKRPQNRFMDIVVQMMSETEALASKLYPLDMLSHIKTRNYGTQKYEQWIVDVQKKCSMLDLPNEEDGRSLFIYTEHLRKYNDALIINEDARTKDALAYLKEFFENVRRWGLDETEQQLASTFDGISWNIILIQHALKNWITETPELQYLKPDVLMGRGTRNQGAGPQTVISELKLEKTVERQLWRSLFTAMAKSCICENLLGYLEVPGHPVPPGDGMTLPNQKGVLDSFRADGENKILIATSVADEGIDIAQCNLVLLYEYTGNVIKMIQVRGRGRAKDSKCILVTSKKEQECNEKANVLKEKMMNRAIEEVQSWTEEEFAQKINSLQKELKRMQDSKKKEPVKRPLPSNKRLLCMKCKAYACDTEDIRVIEGSHHTVLNENFSERYKTAPHSKPRRYAQFEKRSKLYCNADKCHHDWGIMVKYQAFEDLPIIKIESFLVQDVVTGKRSYFRKWKEVDFAIKEFSVEDMS
ncbi:putative ATP-dependent RNA helicase DDX58 [Varanus komodoensis]|nr:putative ATP-dependent RNA helicase DDX58 [Varanus komodoensis]